MSEKRVLIFGGNSDVAIACANEYKRQGMVVTLTGHKPNELPDGFSKMEFDVQRFTPEQLDMFDADIVLYAAGRFFPNEQSLFQENKLEEIEVNFTAAVRILSHFAKIFKDRNQGVLVGISSIAAVRGKSSTVIYGASKAGFDSFLGGLRSYLSDTEVKVLTVRPGYLKTKMTEKLNLPAFLTGTATGLANKIVQRSLKGNQNILYYTSIWRPIAFIIKNIPETLFKRMKL